MAHTANLSVNAQEGVFCAWMITLILLPLRASNLNRYGYYEVQLISNAHSEIFCQQSIVAMRAQCVLVATTLLHSSAKFHSFLFTGSKTVRVNMESCYGGMSTRFEATCGD